MLGLVLERLGDRRDGLVECREVGPVGAGLQVADPGVVDRGGVNGDVPGVEGFELLELALLGVQAQHRLVHEPVEHDRADRAVLVQPLADGQVDVAAHVRGLAEQRLGDPAGPPRRDPAGPDLRPEPRGPVRQHQHVADQRLAGARRHAVRGRERRRRVPGHRRETDPLQVLDIDLQLGPGLQPGRRVHRRPGLLARQRRVRRGVLQRQLQDRDLSCVPRPALLADPREQVPRQGRGVGEGVGQKSHRGSTLTEHTLGYKSQLRDGEEEVRAGVNRVRTGQRQASAPRRSGRATSLR